MDELLENLAHDPQLRPFLSADCDVKAIASDVVAQDSSARPGHRPRNLSHARSSDIAVDSSYSEQFVHLLSNTVQDVDRAVGERVGDQHAELLKQVGSVEGLQSHVSIVQRSVGDLKKSIQQLESHARRQQETLTRQVRAHSNIHASSDLVRRVLRFHQLSQRILESSKQEENSHENDQPDTESTHRMALALALREIETISQDHRFEEISIVQERLPSIRRIRATLRRNVHSDLRVGVHNLSQADVGEALQVLYYLGALEECVQSTVNALVEEVERKCSGAIAQEKLVGQSNALDRNGQVAHKADVWEAFHRSFDTVRSGAVQVWNLQRVLMKMTDGTSQQTYLDMVLQPDEPSLVKTFWDVSCAVLREVFTSALSYRPAIRDVIVNAYPRVREEATRVLRELLENTSPPSDSSLLSSERVIQDKGKSSTYVRGLSAVASTSEDQDLFLDAMESIYEAYMNTVYKRLSHPVELMFPQNTGYHTAPPSRSDVQTLSRAILTEIESAGKDAALLDGVLTKVQKVVQTFCGHANRIAYKGNAASLTTATFGRTQTQAHNVVLINAINYVAQTVDRFSTLLTEGNKASSKEEGEAEAALTHSCEKHATACRELLDDATCTILGPYLQALAGILERVIAKMHNESFGDPAGDLSSGNTSRSHFMVEFNATFNAVIKEHIQRLPDIPIVVDCIQDLAARIVSMFIRHAALLRPLMEAGKLRLANDLAQLELQMESMLPIRALGRPYEELRAFRKLIFLDDADLARDPTVDKVRPSNVWHHLIGRGPPELQLPHFLDQTTPAKYIEWLETRAGIAESAQPASYRDVPLGYPCLKDEKVALKAEKAAWKMVSACLDVYSQRVNGDTGASNSIYSILEESGPTLLAGYPLLKTDG